jgi:membrane peptidoglycan carboxypeptidase
VSWKARHGGRRARNAFAAVVATTALLASACGPILELELPSVDTLEVAPRTPPQQSIVYDADGRQLAVLRDEFRERVSLSAVPRHLVDAVLVAEDRRFFDHRGVDARAVVRALLTNVAAGDIAQGGSTITQQLVKNLYLPDAPRTPETKVQEALLARELERTTPKADILEDYLNTVYLGEGAHGVQAASWTYFRKDAADLDVAEAALVAAIIRAPEALAPTREPEAARKRRDDLLRRMAADGRLTVDERDTALHRPIVVHPRPPAPGTEEPHFVALVVRSLLSDPRFGATEAERAERLYGGGLRIHTTLRPELQDLARATLAAHLPDEEDPEAAIAMVDPATGHVLAAVGNRSYDQLQFDLATQARRQAGSTFKAFVLAAAIADGWHPDDRVDGRQGLIDTGQGSWEVRNYDRRDHPRATLTDATRASINASFARLGRDVGIRRVATLSEAMGIASSVPHDPQITIGGGQLAVTPLDLAAAFGTLANLGTHVPTTVVSHIEDADGRVVWRPDTTGRPVLPASAAYVTTQVLREAVERGTGRAARIEGWEVAGKTGTTSDHADAWFVGYTPVLSTAVWVGRAEGRIPLHDVRGVARVTGGTIPARIFADVVGAALEPVEPVGFILPDDEWVLVEVDPRSGLLAAAWCPGRTERLPRVLAPSETCPEPPPPPPPPPEPEPADDEDDEAEDDEAEDDGEPDDADPDQDAPEQDPEADGTTAAEEDGDAG